MRAKGAIHKSRSPARHDLIHEEEPLEELEGERYHRQIPNAFHINKKPGRLGKNDIMRLLARKARSNSPKGTSANNVYNSKHTSKHQSPFARKNSPLEVFKNRGTDVNTSNKMGKLRVSPPKTHGKMSPDFDRTGRKESPFKTNQESEEVKALRLIAKKRHQLNKDLWEAAESGDLVKITQLLDPYFCIFTLSVNKNELKADVNSAGVENRTALHCAAYENKPEALKLLLKYGAFPDARTVHYRTPLHIACILGEETICKILLDSSASTNVQDFEKNTPVHYAAFYRTLLHNSI